MSMRIDVVPPCLSKADALLAVVSALPSGFDALVVDNGSTDGTDRILADRSGQLLYARAGNAVLAALLRYRGAPVHDVAPIRVADRGRLLDLNITDRAFGYPLELLLRAVQAGWRIHEIDVPYRARAGGKSKVSASVRGTLRAARDMTKVACR
ncbi:glycosyltransferase family 2 protein [Actinoallomurus bryophytorum]|nr:glycosyltransferase family 2 protein [Actinoallomurus bryophytorum]